MKSLLPLFAIALACASCAGESPSSAGPAVAAVSAAPSSSLPESSTLTESAGSTQTGLAASAGDAGAAGRPHHTAPVPLEHDRYGGTSAPAVAAEPRRIAPEELRRLLDAGEAILVDVRGESDWAFYRAAEAIHIPFGELAARSAELPHEALIALYCT